MRKNFLCAEVYSSYPDISEKINDILLQRPFPPYRITWRTIKEFIANGNLVFVLRDLRINGMTGADIVAVAFYSFFGTLFNGLVCTEDIFVDKKCRYSLAIECFRRAISEKIIHRKVDKFISKKVDLDGVVKKGIIPIELQIIEFTKKF